MTVEATIGAIVDAVRPDALCDDCLTFIVGLDNLRLTSRITRELARLPGYQRQHRPCLRCRKPKFAIARPTESAP